MTHAEINRALADAMGWGTNSYDPDYYNLDHSGTVMRKTSFSPATSSDHLREWVLPEIERRGLEWKFEAEVFQEFKQTSQHMRKWKFFRYTAHTSVLTAAALKVLGKGAE